MATSLHFLNDSSSKQHNTYSSLFENLSGDDSRIHKILIVTAYWDLSSVNQLITWVNQKRNLGRNTLFMLFINKVNRTNVIDDLLELDKRISKYFSHEDSGVYLVIDSFVHVKGYLIEGIKRGFLCIGSNNLTQPGLNKNQEAIIRVGFTRNKPQAVREFENYVDGLYEESHWIDEYDPPTSDQTLEDFLLDGELWFQMQASDPYQFPMRLPDELLAEAAPNIEEFRGYLDADTQNSLNTKRLIDRVLKRQSKLDNKRQGSDPSNKKAMWKRYTIETSLGYWAPIEYRNYIVDQLKVTQSNTKYHKRNLDVITRFDGEIANEFREFIVAVSHRINLSRIPLVRNSPWGFKGTKFLDHWTNAWLKHIRELEKKLKDQAYVTRLVKGVASTPVPDIRSDRYAIELFEQSFVDNFDYWNKRNSSKALCRDEKFAFIYDLVDAWNRSR